jgi:N-acetylmuramoyl-L-alanine amidase
MPILGIIASSIQNSIASATSFESIATATGTGSNDSVTFSSIPQTFTHLQLRVSVAASLGTQCFIELNSDTGSNYARNRLRGDGSTVAVANSTSTSSLEFGMTNDNTTYSASILAATILDIVDYTNTSKYTTLRSFTGLDVNGAGGRVEFHSGLWMNTAAITTIKLSSGVGRLFGATSVFALYGIKG